MPLARRDELGPKAKKIGGTTVHYKVVNPPNIPRRKIRK